METAKTTPKDFFLWLGALTSLYGSISAFLALSFDYIDRAFPDPLAYAGDPYGGGSHVAMATIIVLTPIALVLLRLIRNSIQVDPSRAQIWVRRWALVLTLFAAGATIAIDLITLLTTFLAGEASERFLLKAGIVLLVAVAVFLHFLADLKGYWMAHAAKATMVASAVGVLALLSVVAGFVIIGTPSELRDLRTDAQRVSDLQNIQYQVVYYWQTKEGFPQSLTELADPLSSTMVPVDPETGASYVYRVTGPLSFELCASFAAETPDTAGQGQFPGRDIAYTSWGPQADENWTHTAGEYCYVRTIDPERYPPFEKR